MNIYEGDNTENKNRLTLVGSQVNLSLKPNSGRKTSRNERPHSAVIPCKNKKQHTTQFLRPNSAESFNLNCYSHGRLPSCRGSTIFDSKEFEKPVTPVSHFTNYSSKFLQNLLKDAKQYKNETQDFYTLINNCEKNLTVNNHEKKSRSLEKLQTQNWVPNEREEKTVRFIEHSKERHSLASHKHEFPHQPCPKDVAHFFSHNKFLQKSLSSRECRHFSECKEKKKERMSEEEYNGNSEIKNSSEYTCDSPEYNRMKKCTKESGNSPKSKLNEKIDSNLSSSSSENLSEKYEPKVREDVEISSEKGSLIPEENDEKTHSENEEKIHSDNEEVRKETSKNSGINGGDESTYDEIVQLLKTLEEEDTESMNLESRKDSEANSPFTLRPEDEKIDQINDVYSYLEEVERCDEGLDRTKNQSNEARTSTDDPPRLEELLNKTSVELAHEVLTLKIQVEDQKKGINLLRETLAEMKEGKKILELEHQKALEKANAEAETLVQRQQKFIKQLISEKKNLNETVSKLVEDLKTEEEKHKKNMKVLEEKHQVEIQRAKEIQAAADKIKREKWMEMKTQKIKELTVKGLEPELSRMAVRQQEEMTELRNLHRAELEAVELRAARRTSELMDQLRAELTKEKEQAIARETAALRAHMLSEFDDEKTRMENQIQMLKEKIRKGELRLSNQEMEFQQKLIDYKRETEKENQKLMRDHQENLEEERRRHLVELKKLRECLDAEKEIWINNYKKEQAAKSLEREAELRQKYKKERDNEIEMIIEALEKESSQIQQELNLAAENKLRRLREKMESEIKELEISESAAKEKLLEIKSQLASKEDFITELSTQIRQLQSEVTFLKKSCEDMTMERANLKKVIKNEFKDQISDLMKEKENMYKEIAILKENHLKELEKKELQNSHAKNEMQKELARVYSRVKAAVSKKEKVIESLKEEIQTINQRCNMLEMMLDKQRRNLLLE